MKYRQLAAMAVVALSLCACGAGKDFTRPRPGSLQLGVTSPDQALAMLGPPLGRSSGTVGAVATTTPPNSVFASVPEPGSYDSLVYAFIDDSGQRLIGALSG